MLLLVVFFSGCVSSYSHSSPEKLGKSVFKMMKKQDANALAALVPTANDLESFLASADLPEEERVYFKNEIGTIIEEYQGSNYNAYLTANDVMSRERVLFSKSKLKDIKVETWQGMDNMLGKIVLAAESEGREFEIVINEAGQVASGWVLGEKGFEVKLKPKASK